MFDETIDYLKVTLENIKSVLIATKETLSTIGNIISVIISILGFIGFRVFILLISTTFVANLLNMVSATTKKLNYIVSIIIILWLGISTNMPFKEVILKYLIIIIAPLIIGYFLKASINYYHKIYNLINPKLILLFNKINFNFFINKKMNLNENNKIAIIFTSDLPTIEEYKDLKNVEILESEKISAISDNKRIFFPLELRFKQFIDSIDSENNNLLWFWSSNYTANELIPYFNKEKKRNQTKYIVGSCDNSYILNFLQNKWNWKVIYGFNYKNYQNKNIILKPYTLSLLNIIDIKDNFSLNEKIVGSDLSVLVNEIGSNNRLNFKNRILFLDAIFKTKMSFYRSINQLLNYITNYKLYPQAIVFGNISIDVSYIDIIELLSSLKIPLFKINDFQFIKLNEKCLISYENKQFLLKVN